MNVFISTKGTQDGYPGQQAYQHSKSMTDTTYGPTLLECKNIHLIFLSSGYIYFGRKLYVTDLILGAYIHKRGKGKNNGNYNALKKMLNPLLKEFCKHACFDLRKCLEPNLSYLSLQNFHWQL